MIEIIAHNYGTDHPNAIHNDAGARQHGFAGALVPGVAVYGYLTRPAVSAWGIEWLTRGAASVRFLQPVYHGERVLAQVDQPLGQAMNLQLLNAAQQVCAVGSAALPAELPNIDIADYVQNETRLRPATIASFQLGEPLGTLTLTLNWPTTGGAFLVDMNDDNALYQNAVHPSFWLAQANEVFMRNIALGMWIHTASEIQHFALPQPAETISICGRVSELFERKGHEYLVASLIACGADNRLLTHIKHTAIIRLREKPLIANH